MYLITNDSDQGVDCAPRYPSIPTIILRMDDIGANRYSDTRFVLVDEIIAKNISLVLGVIPDNLEQDIPLVKALQTYAAHPKIEIAQHGYEHASNEFENMSEEDAAEAIDKGRAILMKDIGVVPFTFIPPSNSYSKGTINALKQKGFHVISAKEDEYRFDGTLFFVGKNVETYDFYHQRFIPAEEILQTCTDHLLLTHLCVVTIHPQDFLNEQFELETQQFTEFLNMLDRVSVIGVQFNSFKDLMSCETTKRSSVKIVS